MKRIVVAVLVLLATAQSAWAAPAPLRVSGISPAVADRGELVTITGGGFGAGNLEVTVGGVRAELVTATGSTASFRVPAAAPFGPVEVVARNPGGHEGRIGLTVRFDGQATAVADESAAVSVPVGSEGGTIGVGGISLAIPAGAVPDGTTITATPLLRLDDSPFAATPVGLKLEPSGLVLLRPATLTLPTPAGAGQIVGFGFDGNGSDLHLVPHTATGGSVSVMVWHFSGAGAIAATVAELAAVLDYLPTPAHMLAEQRIAAALAIEANGGAPAAPAIFTALSDWWIHSVLRGLQAARDTERLDFFELGFGEWQAWAAYVAVYDDNFTPTQNSVTATSESVNLDVATTAAARIARRTLTRCVGPGIPRSALRDVLRLASAVNMAELPIDQNTPSGQRTLPAGGGLARACVDVRLLAFTHAPTFARNRDNRFTARAEVAFWDGPSSSTVPLRYRLRDATSGPTAPLASGTSATGSYDDTITPGSLGVRHYELTVDLDTSGGDAILAAIFDRTTDVVPVHERLDLQGRRLGDAAFGDLVGAIAPGGTVFLRVRLAGDDVAGKTISLTHDSAGSVAASTTTDANGEAFLTYVAPSVPQIELVNATITEGAFTSGDAVVITTQVPVTVTVSPAVATLAPGATQQFTATVTGTANTTVTWSATGGTITSSGLYTAGSGLGSFSVTARTSTSPVVVGGAAITIAAPASVVGLYIGDYCQISNSTGEQFCVSGMRVSYQCILESHIHAGSTCGWFAQGGGLDRVPNLASFCQIETSGTSAGGFFVGSITWCRFGPVTDRQRSTRIEGTIENGRLEFDVFWHDAGEQPVHELFRGTRFVP